MCIKRMNGMMFDFSLAEVYTDCSCLAVALFFVCLLYPL